MTRRGQVGHSVESINGCWIKGFHEAAPVRGPGKSHRNSPKKAGKGRKSAAHDFVLNDSDLFRPGISQGDVHHSCAALELVSTVPTDSLSTLAKLRHCKIAVELRKIRKLRRFEAKSYLFNGHGANRFPDGIVYA